MRHLPHGRYLSIAVLLLVVVYCNCNLAEALDSEEQQRGTGDELTHAVRKPKRPQIPIWWIWTPSTLKAHLHRRESLARSPWIGNMFWGLNPTMQLGARTQGGVTMTQMEPNNRKRHRRSTDKNSEIWTPWVGKRNGGGKGGDIWTPWVGKRTMNGGGHRQRLANSYRYKDKDSEIWTPWVGKRSGGGKDSEIWTPWVGKRSGMGSDLNEQEDMREYDSLDKNTWVYPLPQNI